MGGGMRHLAEDVLDSLSVNTIVSCGNVGEVEAQLAVLPSGKYKKLSVTADDSPHAQLAHLLSTTVDLILERRPAGLPTIALIHCFRGASRSPSVTTAVVASVTNSTIPQ